MTETRKTEIRKCPFCGAGADMIHDDNKLRAYECIGCLAVERIHKSPASWWYSGWQQLDRSEGVAGDRIGGDDEYISPAPVIFSHWVKDIPPDALSA